MPFEDLTDAQQDFIARYFKTGTKWRKNKKQTFNADLKILCARVYDRINRLERGIIRLEADYPHARVDILRSWLEEAAAMMTRTLQAAAKDMKKKMKLPDLKAVRQHLDRLEDAIDAERLRLFKKAERQESDRGKKEAAANTALDRVRGDQRQARQLFTDCIRSMTTALPADVDARDQAIASYDQAFHSASHEILEKIRTEAPDDQIALEPFTTDVDTIAREFVETTSPLIERLWDLKGKGSPSQQECLSFLESKQDLEVAVRETERLAKAEEEIGKLTAAVASQNTKLDKLRGDFRKAKGKKKEELRTQAAAVTAQIEKLEGRLGQLNAWKEGLGQRALRIVETEQLLSNARKQAESIAEQIEDQHAPLNSEFDMRLQDEAAAIVVYPNTKSIRECHKRLTDQVAASAARDIIADRVFTGETSIKEISQEHQQTLNLMLANADAYIEDGSLNYASVILHDVQQLWFAFVLQRRTGLPVAPSPPTDAGQLLLVRIDRQESQARDLWGQGLHEGERLLTQIRKLRKDTEAKQRELADPADAADEHAWEPLEEKVKQLQSVLDAVKVRPHSGDAAQKAREAARETADDVYDALKDLYRSKEITRAETIEQIGRTYTDAEREELIPADRVLSISQGTDDQGNPEFRYYEIKTRTAGGKDLHRRKEKDVPREMMDYLKQRADTLAMMAESTALGCDDVMNEYASQTKVLLEEIAENGPETFKAISTIFKGCDRMFEKEPLRSFLPSSYGEVKAAWDKFKSDYSSMLPSLALEEARRQGRSVAELAEFAKALKQVYDDAQTSCRRLNTHLSAILNDAGLMVGGELGAEMGALIDGKAEQLLAACDDGGDPDKQKQLQLAAEKITAAKKTFKSQGFSKTNMEGTYRKQLESVYRKLESKTEQNIKLAVRELNSLNADMDGYLDEIKGMNSLTGDALIAFVVKTADQILDMARGASDQAIFRKQVEDRKKDLEAALKQLKKDINSKGNTAIKEEAKAKCAALKTRVASEYASAEKYRTWEAARDEMDAIAQELTELSDAVGSTAAISKQKISQMTVADKVPQAGGFIERLENRAGNLADDEIRPAMSDQQQDDLAAAVANVADSLAMVKDLPGLSTLMTTAEMIDQANIDKENGSTKAARVKLREQALAQLHEIRGEILRHPAVEMYRSNPFDLGRQVNYLESSFHQLEIAILASVDPRKSK